jgi:uncharacterized integral membrane protein
MPAVVKTPRFIISTIFLIWLITTIWQNHNVEPVNIYYAPFLRIQVPVIWVLLTTAAIGALIALVVMYLWNHRASKNASSSFAA